jgi:uncharacterized protein
VKPLTIHVDDIKESAQPWEAELSRQEIDEILGGDHPTEFHAAGLSLVKARLTRMGRKVLVQSAFGVPLAGTCKRCLKDVALGEQVELTLTFSPAPAAEPEHKGRKKAGDSEAQQRHAARNQRDEEGSDGSFDPQLADEETYSGHTIDLWPFVREQVLLAVPPSPLCSEGCKGLCPACGQDLNLRDCGHRQENLDPRWQALKGLQLEQSQPKSSKE